MNKGKNMAKSFSCLLVVGLLGGWLAGCASPARFYDDSKVALIRKDATTEGDLLEWFGPANSRAMASDGSKTLAWRFAPATGNRASSGGLNVRIGADGRVISYSASRTEK